MTKHKAAKKQDAVMYDPYDLLGQGVKSNKNFAQKQHPKNNKPSKIRDNDSL